MGEEVKVSTEIIIIVVCTFGIMISGIVCLLLMRGKKKVKEEPAEAPQPTPVKVAGSETKKLDGEDRTEMSDEEASLIAHEEVLIEEYVNPNTSVQRKREIFKTLNNTNQSYRLIDKSLDLEEETIRRQETERINKEIEEERRKSSSKKRKKKHKKRVKEEENEVTAVLYSSEESCEFNLQDGLGEVDTNSTHHDSKRKTKNRGNSGSLDDNNGQGTDEGRSVDAQHVRNNS